MSMRVACPDEVSTVLNHLSKDARMGGAPVCVCRVCSWDQCSCIILMIQLSRLVPMRRDAGRAAWMARDLLRGWGLLTDCRGTSVVALLSLWSV